MIKYYCDICGKELLRYNDVSYKMALSSKEPNCPMDTNYHNFDLCEECMRKVCKDVNLRFEELLKPKKIKI